MKRRSMDYDGPIGLATVLCGDIISKDHTPFQSPSNLPTRREDAERPSEEGLLCGATEAE